MEARSFHFHVPKAFAAGAASFACCCQPQRRFLQASTIRHCPWYPEWAALGCRLQLLGRSKACAAQLQHTVSHCTHVSPYSSVTWMLAEQIVCITQPQHCQTNLQTCLSKPGQTACEKGFLLGAPQYLVTGRDPFCLTQLTRPWLVLLLGWRWEGQLPTSFQVGETLLE